MLLSIKPRSLNSHYPIYIFFCRFGLAKVATEFKIIICNKGLVAPKKAQKETVSFFTYQANIPSGQRKPLKSGCAGCNGTKLGLY